MEILGILLFCLLDVGFSGPVTTSQTSAALDFESCIEVDLAQIEDLKLELFNNIPNFYLEGDTSHISFGLQKQDWDRLRLLETHIPNDSMMKSRLVKVFRLLIAALYQAYVKQTSAKYNDKSNNLSKDILKDKLVETNKNSSIKGKNDVAAPYLNSSIVLNHKNGNQDDTDNEVAGSSKEEIAILSPSYDKKGVLVTEPIDATTEGLNTTHQNVIINSELYTTYFEPKDDEVTEMNVTESSVQNVSKVVISKTGLVGLYNNSVGLIKPVPYKSTSSTFQEHISGTVPNRFADDKTGSSLTHEFITEEITQSKPSRPYDTPLDENELHSQSKELPDKKTSEGVRYSSTTTANKVSFYNTHYVYDSTTKDKTISTTSLYSQGNIEPFPVPFQTSVRPAKKDTTTTNDSSETSHAMQSSQASSNSYFLFTTPHMESNVDDELIFSSEKILNGASTEFTPTPKSILSNLDDKISTPISDHSTFLGPTSEYKNPQDPTTIGLVSQMYNEIIDPEEEDNVLTRTPNITTSQSKDTTWTTKSPETPVASYFDNSLYDNDDDTDDYENRNRFFDTDTMTDNPESKIDIFDIHGSRHLTPTTEKAKESYRYFTILFQKHKNTNLMKPVKKLKIFPNRQYVDENRKVFKEGCSSSNHCVRVKNLQFEYFDLPNGREFVPSPSYNVVGQNISSHVDHDSEYYKWMCKMFMLGKKSAKR